MKRKLIALMTLLAGLALAQAPDPSTLSDRDSHTVTLNIPSILSLKLDATDYLFDFGNTTLTGSEQVSVNSVNYTKASWAAYYNFINNATGSQTFAPTSVDGAGGADYGTISVLTNRAQWTVKIASITDSNGNPTSLTLGNDRVKVFAVSASGKGNSQTSAPTPIAANLALAQANSGGQGKSEYKLYYLFEMDVDDDIPTGGLNESITLTIVLATP